MKHLTLLIFTCLLSTFAFANRDEARIKGRVTSKTGEIVEFASVYFKKTSYGSITNRKGHYYFSAPKGTYTLVVSLMGYKPFEKQIVLNKGDEKVINVVLEENALELGEIVITEKSEARELKETGLAVNVIEPQKIAIQSVQTNELLDQTAGVRIRQDGGLGSRINYNINGLSGNAIKIFIDGVPASNYGSSFSLSSIPPALIERIEVYKGVVPGYLSEDALGGAINIILKQQRKSSLTTSYSIGSFNTHQWNMNGSYRAKNGLTFDGSAFYNYSDNNYKVWGDDIEFKDQYGSIKKSNGQKVKRFHDAYQSFGGKFNFGFTNVKWADQFLLGAVLSQSYKEMQNGSTMQVVYGNRHNRRKSDVFTLTYSKKDFLFKGLSLKVDGSYSYLHRQLIDTVGIQYDWLGPIKKDDGTYVTYNSGSESGNSKTAAIDKDYAAMIRGSLSYQINKNHTFYVNYMFNDFQRKVSDEYQPAALQKLKNTRDLQKNIFTFTYENLAFSDKLRTNIFYKHYFQKVTAVEPYKDNNEYKINRTDKNINHNGYGLTLSYALLADLYLLGSVEKALRLPSADELFGSGTDNSSPATNLKPESSLNANFGFNYEYRIKVHTFSLNSSVYFRDTKDMIREALDGKYEYSQAENLEAVFTRGIDAEFNYNYAKKFNFRFNISRFDVLFNTKYNKKGEPYNYYRMQIRNEPSFKFNGQIAYSFNNVILKNSILSISYNISYVNGFLRNWSNVGSKNLDYIPNQYPMDLGLTYTFPKNKFVLSFDAKNILDQQVYDNFGLQKPGRAFYAKLTYFIL